nr:glycosyltransferase [uncultured Duganella sp.]
MNELVTIFIPTKNRLPLLRRAVASVLGQTARNIELIVVSDGADDGTCEWVESLRADIPVRLIHNAQSRGACTARNQALEVARGAFVTGLDDDDFFMPHRIERFLAHWRVLEDAGTAFSCLFDTCIIDEGARLYVVNPLATVDTAQILYANHIGNQVFTRRERMLEIGMYDPTMVAWQDWETWVRLVKRYGPAHNIYAKTYYADTTHEFARISRQSQEKIMNAAHQFHRRHCAPGEVKGVLQAISLYPQIELSVRDLLDLCADRRYKTALQKLVGGKARFSLDSSIAR